MAKHGHYAVELNANAVRHAVGGDKSQQNAESTQEVLGDTDQISRFKELARELGCNEDEAAFEDALKRLAETKPLPKHEPQKRSAKKTS